MNIAVIGAGALGCLFGGRLTESGHDVYLLHYRQAYVDHLNEAGLTIESENDEKTDIAVTATTDANEIGVADLVIVFVKSHQTRDALAEHAACIGPETDLLSLQNGLRHYDRLLDIADEDHSFAGVTYQGAVVEEPGYIRVTSSGSSTFGGANDGGLHRIEEILVEAGFPVELVDDPRPYIWAKQLVSLPIKPLAALTHLSNGELIETPETRTLMKEIVAEAEYVAEHHGVDIPMDDPMAEVVATCEESYSHYSSMLQDIRAKRKTEIDDVNGAIVDIAREEDVDVPINELATNLVRALEKSYLD
ncbi:ketopantoate reductase family protein [Halalkalicoccus jeotgali]|uniref:2-dehydropantoate 2-reductase n=1 Tax=Halalkalicoccus jeotgali (strain DSM 18796 / CECT 7217 / JCM 14584 / KCTC 4019 / B3) TaxID=795797 RepID=D8JCV3_HALJB|nr:2-dehydropantoate 2-reductase [Halalkalicoccus jeotgali]ADJ16848.1 2-dehydropantoate 2-reductase [Halalkalicoccus jeotgali B3]ELY38716.1 2-dehydropantoate 2-reductase [Halalkalicoccus jeotgali B3]